MSTTATLVHRRLSHSHSAPPRRRASSSHGLKAGALQRSKSLSSASPLDSPTSPVPTLASIRILALAQLAEIETCLASVTATASGDMAARVDDARSMVRKIREVCSRLPNMHLDVAAVEELVTHHLPDWADVQSRLPTLSFDNVRTRLAEIELPDIRSRLPDWEGVLAAMRAELSDLDDRLHALSISAADSSLLSELLDRIASSDLFDDWRESEESSAKEQAMVVTTAGQIVRALRASADGTRHISYDQLPHLWKNNEFVQEGYRFIPLSKWKTLALSAFRLHNETLNIHTHFVPLVLSLLSCTVLGPSADYVSWPDMVYTYFARVCLLTSAIWHCFAGCSHPGAMEFFARLDYVGIGWLISASISTIVYFSLSCHKTAAYVYLSACLISAVVGSFLPFMQWFNERKHKKWRLLYFVLLSLSGIAPCFHLAFIHSGSAVFHFVSPTLPSLAAYSVGVVFYATHFPECMYPHRPRPKWAAFFDTVGLSSHALWHLLILLGIWLHRWALREMSAGFEGELCALW